MYRWIVALILLLTCLSSPASAACRGGYVNLFPGSESRTFLIVSSGQVCGFIVSTGPRDHFDNVAVAERPRHGTVSPRSGVGVNYKSARGYKGEDYFVFMVTGEIQSTRGSARVRVRVTVL
jgi:hypothetical protein